MIILKEEIEKAATSYTNKSIDFIEGFISGADFVESKFEKFAIKFGYFCIGKDWRQNGYVYGKNTEELFEMFLKELEDE
jgi:hypothetical protein